MGTYNIHITHTQKHTCIHTHTHTHVYTRLNSNSVCIQANTHHWVYIWQLFKETKGGFFRKCQVLFQGICARLCVCVYLCEYTNNMLCIKWLFLSSLFSSCFVFSTSLSLPASRILHTHTSHAHIHTPGPAVAPDGSLYPIPPQPLGQSKYDSQMCLSGCLYILLQFLLCVLLLKTFSIFPSMSGIEQLCVCLYLIMTTFGIGALMNRRSWAFRFESLRLSLSVCVSVYLMHLRGVDALRWAIFMCVVVVLMMTWLRSAVNNPVYVSSEMYKTTKQK